MTEKKVRWIRVPDGAQQGLYQIAALSAPVNIDQPQHCPCCGEQLAPGVDICQWGLFEDHYLSYLICGKCAKAFELDYTVPTYELLSKREQKRCGLLLSKKSPGASQGSDRRER